jgi:hypothetical protein
MVTSVSSGTQNISGSVSASVTTTLPAPGATQVIKIIKNNKSASALVAGTGALLYTVTGGKILYITSINIQGGSVSTWELRDGTTIAGAIVYVGRSPTDVFANIVLPTPIPFTAGVFIDVGTNCSVTYSLVGYEQ